MVSYRQLGGGRCAGPFAWCSRHGVREPAICCDQRHFRAVSPMGITTRLPGRAAHDGIPP